MLALAAASRRHRWIAAIEFTWFGVDQILAYPASVVRRAVAEQGFAASVAHHREVEARMAALDDTSVMIGPEERVYERRRATAAALQRAIDSVDGGGHSTEEVASALAGAIATQGLHPLPEVWLHNVARELAAGRHYVVSADSSPLASWGNVVGRANGDRSAGA
jgi:hypothetical protein